MTQRGIPRPRVRIARLRHAPVVARVIRASFAEYLDAAKKPVSARLSARQVRLHIRTGKKRYALAYLASRPVGAVGYRVKGRRLTFGPVGVLPRRRKAGVGAALIAWVERRGRVRRCREIRAEVLWGLAHLKEYYRKRGYRIVEKNERTYAVKRLAPQG